MKNYITKRKQLGASLLEIVLVLAIGASIIMLANRQYQSYKLDAEVQRTIANVDILFSASADYYQANCKNQWNPATGPIAGSGTLDPRNTPDNPFGVPVPDLTTQGFHDTLLPRTVVVNVDDLANPGYIVQFNRVDPPQDREIELSGQATPARLGNIIMYTVQVSVLLSDSSMATAYRNILGAQCLSTLDTSGASPVVTPCRSVVTPIVDGPGQSVYAVFERLPSYANPRANSQFWVSNPDVKLFNQEYEVAPTQYLTTQDNATDYPQQNYMCGS